ncbi:linear amide C-N hydrolase [Vagococcus sp.]|uniref:linear amide C-N hydrolase n=1 Tax=Vagococcus sp. TaxID=1933889 RepID=UPI003F9E1D55
MCTGMTLKATNGDLFFGRTLDLDLPLFGEDSGFPTLASIMNIPANQEFPSHLNKWTTKYAVLGIAIDETSCLFDGINEKGLVGDCQVLKEATWMSKEELAKTKLTPCLAEEFVAYVLTNFKNVQELREAVDQLVLVDQKYEAHGLSANYPLHFSFVDESGDGIVLEPVNNGQFKVYDYSGVMANSPEYDYHEINIRNYIGLKNIAVKQNQDLKSDQKMQPIEGGTGYGLFGLPGDYTSPSRYVKAYFIKNFIDDFDTKNGIAQLYAAFRPLIIPRGLEHTNEETPKSDYTRYWAGYDITNREMFVQSGVGLAITGKKLSANEPKISYEKIDVTNHINFIS